MENTVRIFVGGGMSFEVPRTYYDEAITMATLTGRVWFVGLKGTDEVEVGPDRLQLLANGCHSVAWIMPMNSKMTEGEAA